MEERKADAPNDLDLENIVYDRSHNTTLAMEIQIEERERERKLQWQ